MPCCVNKKITVNKINENSRVDLLLLAAFLSVGLSIMGEKSILSCLAKEITGVDEVR